MDVITIIPCGTKAIFGEIEGWIGAIEITFTNIVYKFEYFDKDQNHKFVWCHEKELSIQSKKRQPIGFQPINSNGH
jgi:hypothetical protein